MAMKNLTSMQDLENHKLMILEFIWNNSDIFPS